MHAWPHTHASAPHGAQLCAELLELRPTVVRGNASEVLALGAASSSRTKGVDSSDSVAAALPAARALAARHGCVVAVSGAVDAVTDGRRTVRVANGSPMLQTVTATGCSVTALIAAFLAVHVADPIVAAAHALAYFGCGDGAKGRGPGMSWWAGLPGTRCPIFFNGAACRRNTCVCGASCKAPPPLLGPLQKPCMPPRLSAAANHFACSVAAERAAADAGVRGPASFRTALLDELYCLAQSLHPLAEAVKLELEQEQELGGPKHEAQPAPAAGPR